MKESLETLMKDSYDFNKSIFDSDYRWAIIKELYDKNFVYSDHQAMPKKIHQIWMGGELPKRYRRLTETWVKFHPDWEYKLWTDKDVNDVDIPRRKLFNSITHLGQKSDFLRYHILKQYGGLYVDTDFECLKPFDTLLYAHFLTGIGYPSKLELYIGLIGTIPEHPIISRVVSDMDEVRSKGWREVFNTTGTYFFTSVFFKVVTEYMKGIVALPPDYFYPFPNKERHRKNARAYIKDCSYAIHYWAVSWK